jgi:tRNA1(Val) A37 N6-methylase TrmN6
VQGGRAGVKVEAPFCIYREDGGYSEEMQKIYRLS